MKELSLTALALQERQNARRQSHDLHPTLDEAILDAPEDTVVRDASKDGIQRYNGYRVDKRTTQLATEPEPERWPSRLDLWLWKLENGIWDLWCWWLDQLLVR